MPRGAQEWSENTLTLGFRAGYPCLCCETSNRRFSTTTGCSNPALAAQCPPLISRVSAEEGTKEVQSPDFSIRTTTKILPG